jgi:TetR/AcrR family transcriptional regulator, transcriptional repressor for nem operon
MRYEKGRKDATRQRIVEVASKQFRGGGLAATGIASVMSEAGLTNGAFYPHFSSKDDLITKTLAAELAKQNERQKQFVGTDEGLERAIRSYLRRGHRENAKGGCPSAALLPEIARAPRETRQAYQDGLAAIIDTLARHFPDDTEDQSRRKAIAIFGLLVGTMQIARAIPNAALAQKVLDDAVDAALTLSHAPRAVTARRRQKPAR